MIKNVFKQHAENEHLNGSSFAPVANVSVQIQRSLESGEKTKEEMKILNKLPFINSARGDFVDEQRQANWIVWRQITIIEAW